MAVSKIQYAGTTLIDLTADTVTSKMLLIGETGHAADGSAIVGTMFEGYPSLYFVPNRLLDSRDENVRDSYGEKIDGRTLYKKQ